MKLGTVAIDTPAGELRRVGAIRKKDGFFVDLAAGREALLKTRGAPRPYDQAQLDCPSDMLAFIRAGDDALKKGYEVLDFAAELGPEKAAGPTVVDDPAPVRPPAPPHSPPTLPPP